MVVNARKGMTAVASVKMGNAAAILLMVLRVFGNSLKDSYTGTLFSAILGRKT